MIEIIVKMTESVIVKSAEVFFTNKEIYFKSSNKSCKV